ncbi:hypothetical protein J1N35_011912 [Gossypium stocksii]|uniref:Uncharacterized protein n=1 Tax=Gossypium stocksii TaxID=47602 RepID=A0A9D3W2W4_9ROSI|nr:hypothetical protein J1N35_011912 [Gossypium stocksii]
MALMWNFFPPRLYTYVDAYVIGGCGFFKWYDDKLCNKANEVILELRDSERKLAKENTKLRKQIIKCRSVEMFESGSRSSNVKMSESGSVQNMGKDNQTKEALVALREPF